MDSGRFCSWYHRKGVPKFGTGEDGSMKEIIEEYGGVIVACIMGLLLLGVLFYLLQSNPLSLIHI